MDPELAKAIHQMNGTAHEMNQHIVDKSATMQDVPIDRTVYEEAAKARERIAQQQAQYQQAINAANPQPQVQIQPQVQVQPQVQQVVQQDLSPLIERVDNLEKMFAKFVTLIERNVAKNAKEINIRIKLNENNDSTDKQ